MTKIGILALQGAFAEHEQVLKALGVETVQATIFRTNPQNTLIILAKLTYPFSMQTIICSFGIIFFKVGVSLGIII